MSQAADSSEPASELERLITDLSASGPLVFVFGVSWWTAPLAGATAPEFGGPADRRWWAARPGGPSPGFGACEEEGRIQQSDA